MELAETRKSAAWPLCGCRTRGVELGKEPPQRLKKSATENSSPGKQLEVNRSAVA